MKEAIIESCGEYPDDFVEQDIDSDPNFVFNPDPDFINVRLQDSDGNVAIVNSFLECQHYVKGGWKSSLISNKTVQTTNDSIFPKQDFPLFSILLFPFILIPIIYLIFKKNKNKTIETFNNLKINIFQAKFPNYLSFFIFAPIFINFMLKISRRGIYFPIFQKIESTKYLSAVLSFIFFLLISKYINDTFKLNSYSLSLSYFLSSFFLFEFLLMPISKNFSFSVSFLFVNFCWISVLLFKNRSLYYLPIILFLYSMLYLYNNINFEILSNLNKYRLLNYDVEAQWLPISKMIYENNYFYSIENNIIPGYGLMLSYVQAVIYKFNFIDQTFNFINSNSYLVFLFSFLIFFDLKISKLNKVLLSLTFLIVVLDDGWLRFLIADSLMLEGIVSFLFASFVINLRKYKLNKEAGLKEIIFMIFFSTLLFSKQFIELLVLIVIIGMILFSKNKKFTIIGLSLYSLHFIYQKIFFPDATNVEYIDGLNFSDLIFDFILLRDLNFENFAKILSKINEYWPMAYILYSLFIFFLINLITNKKLNLFQNINIYLVILNFLFVSLLYLSWWQNIETDSSYRYIMNTIHLIFASVFYEINSLQKKT
tara:strand:+ start:2386 stop:4170 length:1785 start_codon:yes stop_codon:yes gene_type:complete